MLTESERKSIRSDIYVSDQYAEDIDFSDGKISFFMKYARNKRVLDIGCVDHHQKNFFSKYSLHRALKVVAKSVVGLDYYEEGIKAFKELGNDVILADAQHYDLNKKFDVISAGDILEHLENFQGFFESNIKHLADGGVIVLSTPNVFCWKYVLYTWAKGSADRVNPEHTCWFCIETLKLLINRYNLEIIETDFVSRRRWEKLIPLPRHVKHTTICVAMRLSDEEN
jgi:2-polyprenyl-3-methyl-5-hydroxy-6-metoxy-1,4-benzoquinol methylase